MTTQDETTPHKMNTATTVFYNGRTYTYAQAEEMLRGWFSLDTWGMSQSFREWLRAAILGLSDAIAKATNETL